MKGKIAFVMLLLALLPAIASAATYYVDKNSIGGACSDSNAGTSLTAPLCTIKQASLMMKAGDTVLIRAGTYNEDTGRNCIIDPRVNGNAQAYVTYKNYNGERVIITGVYQPICLFPGMDYIWVEGIEVDGSLTTAGRVELGVSIVSNYNVIKNCYIHNIDGAEGISRGIWIHDGTHNQRILNNTISYIGHADPNNQGANVGDSIWTDGAYTLMDGNNISYCGHNCLLVRGSYSIASNNDLHSHRGRSGEVHSSGTVNSHLVFEQNSVHDSGGFTPGPCAAYGIQTDSAYTIIRNNMFYNNHGHGLEIWGIAGAGTAKNDRVYNNVMFGNGNNSKGDVPYNEGYGIDFNFISETNAGDFSGVIMKNNILYKNRYIGVNYKGSTEPTRHFEINNFEDTNGTPLFADENNHNFHLTSSSVCIDTGAWLTTTSSAGSGTSIPISDAGYFIDGFGIVDGDVIQLQGQATTARITSINYDTNTLTVNTSLTWSNGLGVALPYSGSAPDIGAYEYMSSTPPPQPVPGDLTGDGKVDVADLSIVALDFGKTIGFSNSKSDTNGDNIVDIFDIVYVASRFT